PPSNRMAAEIAGSTITSHSNENEPLADWATWCPPDSEALARMAVPTEVLTSVVTSALRPFRSVLQQAGVVDGCRAASAEYRHDDRQPHHDLGRGHDHHEERHELAVQRPGLVRERDERQVGGVQH